MLREIKWGRACKYNEKRQYYRGIQYRGKGIMQSMRELWKNRNRREYKNTIIHLSTFKRGRDLISGVLNRSQFSRSIIGPFE